MAKIIAGSGWNSHHFQLAHQKNPDKIHVLVIEVRDGPVSVTRSKKMIVFLEK